MILFYNDLIGILQNYTTNKKGLKEGKEISTFCIYIN